MKTKARPFLLGAILGCLTAFPAGTNFGRGEPLLSNPFAKRELQDKVLEGVRSGAETALEGARDTLHEATRPQPSGA